ncbi:MFS transporter [Streptosporangium lutulentum]
MIAADLGRFLALATIPLAFMFDAVTLTHLYIVAAVVGVLTTFFEVSYQSWLPQLIGTENLVEGNTKLQISRSLAEALGAGAGGALMQVLGAARAVTVDAFTFLVSLTALLLIRQRDVRERVEGQKASAAADMKEGLRTLFGTPVLRSLFTSNVVVNFGAAIGDALILVYAYNVLGLSPGQVGIAWAVMAVFVIVGAVLSEQVAKVFTLGRTLVLVAVVLGAGYILVPSVARSAGSPASSSSRRSSGSSARSSTSTCSAWCRASRRTSRWAASAAPRSPRSTARCPSATRSAACSARPSA